ncbi:DUF1761 domain-containing protein [Leptospira semungkisensis]|uniref:DUF1761 domain-containing protein n=1 Tax=Leptospira semungkisensis TaxID=2484985 RepID=A0A4V3JCX3_9LEPT|nr:DUF1761 domain-containing protein [Leptospira semungkisensis]TGK07749.1 DUF1761 domain-containing protein [Leptospira semungkisensis]
MLPINLISVLLATLAAMVLGFLLHGPILGKAWMRLANIVPTGNEKFSDMLPNLFWNLVANFVTAYVLAVVYLFASSSPYLTGSDIWKGVICGIWVWLGFIVTSTSMEVIWMGRKRALWLFECGCSLLVMAVMGAIIAGY